MKTSTLAGSLYPGGSFPGTIDRQGEQARVTPLFLQGLPVSRPSGNKRWLLAGISGLNFGILERGLEAATKGKDCSRNGHY